MKSYAKVNIFLKITGTRDNYHEIASRFVLIKNIFDTIEFVKKTNKNFTIDGNFECDTEENTIYKAYIELSKKFPTVKNFFQSHSVKVEKNIPTSAGLGGGSSNAATFLLMTNEHLNLELSEDELSKLGAKIGADVPFFIYGYSSANVRGIGEIVEKYDELPIDIKLITTDIECNTAKVFQTFRDDFFSITPLDEIEQLFEIDSEQLLKTLKPIEANDLYESAMFLCPSLKNIKSDELFLSGSGSTFFKVIEK